MSSSHTCALRVGVITQYSGVPVSVVSTVQFIHTLPTAVHVATNTAANAVTALTASRDADDVKQSNRLGSTTRTVWSLKNVGRSG